MNANNDRIAAMLDELGVFYERERAFEGLRGSGGKLLRFDFYVPSKPQVCIEYQGPQHFPTGFGLNREGGVERMLTQCEHDAMKKVWCERHLIPLLIILPGLSPATERATLRESLDYWRCYEERVRMGDEDVRVGDAKCIDARFDVAAAKRQRRALNVAPIQLKI